MRHNLDNIARIFIKELDCEEDIANHKINLKYSMSPSITNSPSIESDKSIDQTI